MVNYSGPRSDKVPDDSVLRVTLQEKALFGYTFAGVHSANADTPLVIPVVCKQPPAGLRLFHP